MTHTTPRSKPVTFRRFTIALRAGFAIALALAVAACDPDGSTLRFGAIDELATYADEDGTITATLTVGYVTPLAGARDGIVTFVATTPGGRALDGVGMLSGPWSADHEEEIDLHALYLKIEDIKGESIMTGWGAGASPYLAVTMVESGTQLEGLAAGAAAEFRGPVTVNEILPNTKDPAKEQVLIDFHSDTGSVAFFGGLHDAGSSVALGDVSGPGLMEFEGIFYATPFGPVALGELLLEIPDFGTLNARGFMVSDLLY